MTLNQYTKFKNVLHLATGVALGLAVLLLSPKHVQAAEQPQYATPYVSQVGFKYSGRGFHGGFHGSRYFHAGRGHRFNGYHSRRFVKRSHGGFFFKGGHKGRFSGSYHRSFHPHHFSGSAHFWH